MSKKAALIVIDVQKSFLARPFWVEEETIEFKKAMLELVEGASQRSIPIVSIFHLNKSEGSPFNPASGLIETMDWLTYEPSETFYKTAHNAFTDTGLDRWLKLRGIERLIISGIRTEQCCETTARIASDLGYEVDFVSEATQTFAMKAESGRVLSADDIKERTEIVLAGRFAKISTVKSVLESLD